MFDELKFSRVSTFDFLLFVSLNFRVCRFSLSIFDGGTFTFRSTSLSFVLLRSIPTSSFVLSQDIYIGLFFYKQSRLL